VVISFAAISNEQIRQVVCPTSRVCRADGCVQISRSPDPCRGRASATDSRGLAKATSRMDRARRRVSHVRFLRGAPEAAPQNLCPVGPGRSCLTLFRDLKLVRCPQCQSGSDLAPTLVTNASPVEDSPWRARTVDHSHCPVLAPATLAALPSTRTIPDRTCSTSLAPLTPFTKPRRI
jgi:hypothetical protein